MKIFIEKIKIFIGNVKIFTEKIVTKFIKQIIKKLPKSLLADFYSTVQETGQIQDCGFYLPVSMSRNATVFSKKGVPLWDMWFRRSITRFICTIQ